MVKIALRCESCRYRFSRSIVPNLCPFCGKRSIVEDTYSSAADILHEVEDMERTMSAAKK